MSANQMVHDSVSGQNTLGGGFTFPGTPLAVRRLGYGAMQLAGPGVWGPPRGPQVRSRTE